MPWMPNKLGDALTIMALCASPQRGASSIVIVQALPARIERQDSLLS